jgi:MerR family transcriptional regulator, light-induced transcriptional regulator
MQTLKTSEAAALLNVSPNTLRTWERRFGYPRPRRSPGRHRLYLYAEITALRHALEDGLSISSAVSVASETIGADVRTLVPALFSFRPEQADRAMEVSLALRSVDATVDDVLLPALAEVRRRKGLCSTSWAFAARWAMDWLSRAQRLAPPGPQARGVLIGDASEGALDPASPYIRALELCCARAGAAVLALPVGAVARVAEPISVVQPALVVIAGGHAGDDAVARWAYGVRRAAGEIPFVLFHRGLDADGGARSHALPLSPVEAQAVIAQIVRVCEEAGTSFDPPPDAGGDR